MSHEAEKIGYNKYRQKNVPKSSLNTFRATYDYVEVDSDTGEIVDEGDGDSVLVEAVDRQAAQDIGQENVVVTTLTGDSDTKMVQDQDSPRPQGVFQVTFSVVKGKYGEGDNTILEEGFRLEEDAEEWKSDNSHLAESWEKMRVVEQIGSDARRGSARDYFECGYCNKSFRTEKGLNIHKGQVHK